MTIYLVTFIAYSHIQSTLNAVSALFMSISSFIRNIRESVGFLQLIIVVILAVVQRLILLSLRINNATDFRLCLMCIPCAHKISHLNCVTFKKSQKKSRVSDIRSGGHNNEMRQTPPTTTVGRSCKRDVDGNSRTHTHQPHK